MADRGLDEWYGKLVGVRFVPEGIGDNKQVQVAGTLESADERGVLLGFHGEDEQERLSQHYRFVPWHMIEFIHLTIPE